MADTHASKAWEHRDEAHRLDTLADWILPEADDEDEFPF